METQKITKKFKHAKHNYMYLQYDKLKSLAVAGRVNATSSRLHIISLGIY